MARSLLQGNIDFEGDPPIRTKHQLDEDLHYYTDIDQPTKSWLNSLHHIWSLCM